MIPPPSATAFLAALVLGLRHATDPDHLTAVATLVLHDEHAEPRRAGLLGLAWGLGHALTLLLLGLPAILLGRYLPDGLQRLAEVAVGIVIVVLAVRLLVRWRRGAFHAHPHRHGAVVHAHPHAHERAHAAAVEAEGGVPKHEHAHGEALGRTPATSFGVGMVHGVGGSAAAGVLLIAAMPTVGAAALALAVFALGTAVAMAVVSLVLGGILLRGPLAHRLETVVPVFGVLTALFGCWYVAQAISV